VTYSYLVSESASRIYINEFMAANDSTIRDEAGDFDDWLELHNPEAEPVILDGMYLTDDYSDPTKWEIPDTVIPPDGHLLFWADAEEGEGPLHTNFTLEESGEVIGLLGTGGDGIFTVDWLVFESQYSNTSFGRCPDGGEDWRFFWWGDASPGYTSFVCGDANADCVTNLSDVLYLANYILSDGDPPPDPAYRGNANGDNLIDITDLIYMVNYKLKGGPAPHDCGNYVP